MVDEHGLIVSPQYSFLAASTDGFVTEDANGTTEAHGLLEIKCPVGQKTIEALAASRKNICLKLTESGSLKLKHKHAYYTQVQLEMAVTGRPWTDFVVFTSLDEDEGKDTDIFIERIYFLSSFWENKLLPAAKAVFSKFVVLELLTRRVRRGVPLLV